PGGHCPTRMVLARCFQDGSIDSSFGEDGEVRSGVKSWANAIAIDAAGKIIVGGAVSGGFVVARYNPDGSPDTGFSGNGRDQTFSAYSSARSLAIQADGKIVLGGSSGGGFALARYLAS